MKRKKFFIIKIILIVIISVLIGFGIYTWNAQMVGKTIPMPFGFGLAEVVSDSMSPAINRGDVIMVVPQDEYEVGDVIAFYDSIGLLTHRIESQNEDGSFVTKGDNNDSKDNEALKKEYIIGKVVKTFEGLGGVVSVMQSPPIIIMFVIVIGLLLFLSNKKEKEAEEAEVSKIKQQIAALKKESDSVDINDIQAQIDALKKEAEERNKKKK